MAQKINKSIISTWSLLPPPVGNTQINKTSPEVNLGNIILVDISEVAEVSHELDFLSKTVVYFDYKINQYFQYALIDNRGTGNIRICYNKQGLDLSSAVNGSKTLGSGESFYIEEDVRHIGIYYIEPSFVEIILKSNVSNSDK